jgi:L-seryl-tRNA(Ser) seleniumtransferase
LDFLRGSANHTLFIEQNGAALAGTHQAEFVGGDLSGNVAANEVRFRSSLKMEGTRLGYDFEGKMDGDAMGGTVDLGEYGQAKWTAKRHTYRAPGGVVRPVKRA